MDEDSEDGGDFKRRCGEARVAGGLYIEMVTGPGGVSRLTYVCDPTRPLSQEDITALGLRAVGMTAVEYIGPDGQPWADVYDWIGSDNYPSAWDWLQELRVAPNGLSRKTNPVDPGLLAALNKPGYYVAVSPHGALRNAADYYAQRVEDVCCTDHGEHCGAAWQAEGHTCVSLLREAIDTGGAAPLAGRMVQRSHPEEAATYIGYTSPDGIKPDWQPAEIYRIPKRYLRFAVINDQANPDAVAATVARVRASAPDVDVQIKEH